MIWMSVYHLAFDLNYFGWIKQDFYHDPIWTWQRTAIVSLFVWVAGLSQTVAFQRSINWATFWRRWMQIAGAAVLVTIGSLFLFKQSFIYFGILHSMAIMLIIVRLTAPLSAGWLFILGALLIMAQWAGPILISLHPGLDMLNARAWNWLGLISRLPVTEDYAPLVPWLGVMWWGAAAGQWLCPRWQGWLNGRPLFGSIGRGLIWLGQHSLSYYLLHQVVFMGVLWLVQLSIE